MAAQAIKLFWFLVGGPKGKKGLLKHLGSHIRSSKSRAESSPQINGAERN